MIHCVVQRFKYKDYNNHKLLNRLQYHININPKLIQSIPESVGLLITESNILSDGIELENLC